MEDAIPGSVVGARRARRQRRRVDVQGAQQLPDLREHGMPHVSTPGHSKRLQEARAAGSTLSMRCRRSTCMQEPITSSRVDASRLTSASWVPNALAGSAAWRAQQLADICQRTGNKHLHGPGMRGVCLQNMSLPLASALSLRAGNAAGQLFSKGRHVAQLGTEWIPADPDDHML